MEWVIELKIKSKMKLQMYLYSLYSNAYFITATTAFKVPESLVYIRLASIARAR